MLPNYRNWKKQILKNIITTHQDQAIKYFDTAIKNNQQDFAFAKVEYNTKKKKQLTK
tara:strand:- start:73 stop:243 length:171 start_codon:yes stop_codon:yes gene_type:complete